MDCSNRDGFLVQEVVTSIVGVSVRTIARSLPGQQAGVIKGAAHENEILRILARGDAEIESGVGYDADDVMAEARALLASE